MSTKIFNEKFNFNELFIYDLANNHQGDLNHGLNIIQEISKVSNENGVRGAIKFQFRQLESFIHPHHQKSSEHNQVNRFKSTKLEKQAYKRLFDEVKQNNLITMCTPFDEESVDLIEEMGFDLIKVASCSAKDWPLLERIADANKPVICSTGGLLINDIDNIVSFFDHRGIDFALMHCKAIYPTPLDQMDINQIKILSERYPDKVIGWSTHEDPSNTEIIMLAYAVGARIFERHVGIENETIKLNKYSATPLQIDNWIKAFSTSKLILGGKDRLVSIEEKKSIDSLKRGVYIKKKIKKGTKLERKDVYFAIPFVDEQLESGLWKDQVIANCDLNENEPLKINEITIPAISPYQVLKSSLHEVKALLNKAKIPLNSDFEVEYSHHYGPMHFRDYGIVMINCVNRTYCKKIIIQLPNQKHPSHYHKLKEETFQILYGTLKVEIDGHKKELQPGETLLVLPGVWHSFWTETGVVFEEISTTHYTNDSVYKDKAIREMEVDQRKTKVDHWGRFQLVKDK